MGAEFEMFRLKARIAKLEKCLLQRDNKIASQTKAIEHLQIEIKNREEEIEIFKREKQLADFEIEQKNELAKRQAVLSQRRGELIRECEILLDKWDTSEKTEGANGQNGA